ncbi:MAG: hypothetical protein VKK59_02555, partial [Vampirovibrionales bacterium]|nr:hypothetical protein [Vampirovibrionales bacterium]
MNMSLSNNFFSYPQAQDPTSYHFTNSNINALNIYQQNNQLSQFNQVNSWPFSQPQQQLMPPQVLSSFSLQPFSQPQNMAYSGFNTPLIGNVNGTVNFFGFGFPQAPLPVYQNPFMPYQGYAPQSVVSSDFD